MTFFHFFLWTPYHHQPSLTHFAVLARQSSGARSSSSPAAVCSSLPFLLTATMPSPLPSMIGFCLLFCRPSAPTAVLHLLCICVSLIEFPRKQSATMRLMNSHVEVVSSLAEHYSDMVLKRATYHHGNQSQPKACEGIIHHKISFIRQLQSGTPPPTLPHKNLNQTQHWQMFKIFSIKAPIAIGLYYLQ